MPARVDEGSSLRKGFDTRLSDRIVPDVLRIADRRWLSLSLIAWAAILIWFVWKRWAAIHWLSLGDTDDNMRMMQVRAWLAEHWDPATDRRAWAAAVVDAGLTGGSAVGRTLGLVGIEVGFCHDSSLISCGISGTRGVLDGGSESSS